MKITDIRHSSIFSCGYVPVFPKNSACSVSVFEQAEFWREENIKAFGGNLDNVTLFGQSSGSLTSQTLMLSPLSKGLFNKCILQSGAGYDNGFCKNRKKEEYYDIGEKAVELSGVKSLAELRQAA